jgi:hypothetical protein
MSPRWSTSSSSSGLRGADCTQSGPVLDGLGDASNAAIVVGQHRGVAGGERLAPLLQRRTQLAVREAEDKDPLRPARSTSRLPTTTP